MSRAYIIQNEENLRDLVRRNLELTEVAAKYMGDLIQARTHIRLLEEELIAQERKTIEWAERFANLVAFEIANEVTKELTENDLEVPEIQTPEEGDDIQDPFPGCDSPDE